VHFRPLRLLFFHDALEEMVGGFGCLCCELFGPSSFGYDAEIVGYSADDPGLFPRFTLRGILGGCFVRLPAALREDPAVALGRLDKQDVVFVGGEGYNAGNQPFALRAVT
jgi:hypothetical protein